MPKIIQWGGILPFSLNGNPFLKSSEWVLYLVNSVLNESKSMGAKKIEDEIVDAGLCLLGKKIKKGVSSFHGSGITPTNNEITDLMKVIKSLENRGILLKGTNRKVTSQEGGFLIFLRPLMTAGLPLMKNVLTPLPKNVLLPFYY